MDSFFCFLEGYFLPIHLEAFYFLLHLEVAQRHTIDFACGLLKVSQQLATAVPVVPS